MAASWRVMGSAAATESPQVSLERYRKFFKRSLCIETLLAVLWIVLLETTEISRDSQLQLGVAWAVTAALISMAFIHFVFLCLEDWTSRRWLAYVALFATVGASLLLVAHAAGEAVRAMSDLKARLARVLYTLVVLIFASSKIRLHAKFVFHLRRYKDEEDLAAYLALEGRGDEALLTKHRRSSSHDTITGPLTAV